ncbi:hypothetical protein FRC03_010132 [Tulasnella sp. 419]|nr:hypothetical protein FRC03_010132 [Tulasnella sp. 419]
MRIDMLEAEDPLPALLRTILLPDLAQFTSLTLNGTALFADDLIANHLRYLQRLERLHITDAKEDAVHGIFSALTPSRLSPQHQLLWPCPNLRKLRLHDALFQIERLLDMIEARQGREVRNMTWKGVPLEHLELGRNEIRNMNPNVVRQVEEIIIGQGVFEWPYRKWVTTNYV